MTYRFSTLSKKYYKLFYLFSKKFLGSMGSGLNKKHTKAKSVYYIEDSEHFLNARATTAVQRKVDQSGGVSEVGRCSC
ncbi:hypothetical protein A9266_06595 [Vibrio tasmaniensis]|nr:hypothetical protein A9266_06595 [Vibrio tasmaniensis]